MLQRNAFLIAHHGPGLVAVPAAFAELQLGLLPTSQGRGVTERFHALQILDLCNLHVSGLSISTVVVFSKINVPKLWGYYESCLHGLNLRVILPV